MFLCVTGFHVEVVGQILLGSTFQDQGSFNEFFSRESSASPGFYKGFKEKIDPNLLIAEQ
jgi:hypothetical protein